MTGRLLRKRVLVTQPSDYMGPAIVALFREEGAEVIADPRDPRAPGACEAMVAEAGELDVLVANLAHPPCATPVSEIVDEDFQALLDALVTPLMRLVRAVSKPMSARGHGKIVAVTSAAPLRGLARASSYCAARGAQNAFVRAAGLELAKHNVQLNAVAQNYVHNDAYYPAELTDSPRFREHLARNVPLGRLAHRWESAELALFLASDKSDFMVAQVVPFAGGWAV